MGDPQNFGLDDLGQRVQALGDPAPEPRPEVRPDLWPDARARQYQGAPLPIGPIGNGRQAPVYEAFEHQRNAASPTQGSAPYGQGPVVSAPASGPSFAGSVAQPQGAAPSEPLRSQGSAFDAGIPWSHIAAANASAKENGTPSGTDATSPQAAPASAGHPNLLGAGSDDPNSLKSGLHRAMNAVRSTLPLVQKLLPLLDGNFASVLSTLITTQPTHNTPQQPAPRVDLEPVERGLTELRAGQRDLRAQVGEQVVALKRAEDQLERVREATDRNTLEQQELVEDLRSVGSRINVLAVAGVLLLAGLLAVNIYFLIQLQHILR